MSHEELPVLPGAQTSVLIVAGEVSGDLHGARLVEALRSRCPDLEFFGLGGDRMKAAGVRTLAHSDEISVVGITEVLGILKRAKEIFRALVTESKSLRPTAAVLLDFPDFNLRLAKSLCAHRIPVVYYISPQVWAWRQRRVKTIAKLVDLMLVLFPFEVDFYRRRGVRAVHVGHPLVDEVPGESFRPKELGVPVRLALLPGSRKSEVQALLPVMLAAVKKLRVELELEVMLVRAPSIPDAVLKPHLSLSPEVSVVSGEERHRAIGECDLALCASGTATLEVSLLGTPSIVVYRVGWLTYSLARLLVKIPHIALVNLVLEERVVPELVQGAANPSRICREVLNLLHSPEQLVVIRERLGQLRSKLGESGASGRAADEIVAFLKRRTSCGA